MTRIVFEDVSKIYGDRPRQVQEAMALLRQTVPSDEIFARTSVDLPEPDRPMTQKMPPEGISKLM